MEFYIKFSAFLFISCLIATTAICEAIKLEGYDPTYLVYGHEKEKDVRELRSQISFKTTVYSDLKLAYTQRLKWEIYESSAPIKQFDFNPKLFIQTEFVDYGYEHESNGAEGNQSRSWERLFVVAKYKKDSFFVNLKGWAPFFIHENNGIIDYQGKEEISLGFDNKKVKLGVTSRIKSTRVEASYNFGDFYLYAQIFNGFGPQIIEMDVENHISMLGIALTN